MQAAQTIAQLASTHAHDKKASSPYSQEAVKQGIDIPWILRIATASFSDGKFRLGHLKVGLQDLGSAVTDDPAGKLCCGAFLEDCIHIGRTALGS